MKTEERVSRWVAVADGLPDDGEDVLVAYIDIYTRHIAYGVAWVDMLGQWYSNDDDVERTRVVAWMPIPDYREEVSHG